MNIVIQCAASKHPGGSFKTRSGETVCFVANPKIASELAPRPGYIYATPDDPCADAPGYTWRQRLEEYVLNEPKNPLGLLDAYELYNPSFNPLIYSNLAERFREKTFILSAGWGLVQANYPIPTYNITFSSQAKKNKPWAYCASPSSYRYFQQIPAQNNDPVVFVGGRDYLPVFRSLVERLHRRTIVFAKAGDSAGKVRRMLPLEWEVRPFQSEHSRTWHYECAAALSSGALTLD